MRVCQTLPASMRKGVKPKASIFCTYPLEGLVVANRDDIPVSSCTVASFSDINLKIMRGSRYAAYIAILHGLCLLYFALLCSALLCFAVCGQEGARFYWPVGCWEYLPEHAGTSFAHFPFGIKISHFLFVDKKRSAAKLALRFEPCTSLTIVRPALICVERPSATFTCAKRRYCEMKFWSRTEIGC